jgi:hypothetical protein
LVGFLQKIGAADYPAVIMDDEADQATPDTTTSTRASGKRKGPASTINRRTVENDAEWEFGQSVRETLRHNVFLQVTATPYALLLQNIDMPLRPKFTYLLEPGDGYTGGEHFFSVSQVDDELPPLVFVSEEEADELVASDVHPPIGLSRAISFFLLSASAQHLLSRQSRGQNFLCHTSPKTMEHERVAGLIRSFIATVETDIEGPLVTGETAARFEWAYKELSKTLSAVPSLGDLVGSLKLRLHRRNVYEVNSANDPAEFANSINFIVGGNILGRGLTIENLLVTYYLRRAKISQMDTVLQHARMFGYRAPLMPLTRVFLPESLAVRFNAIHEAEHALRTYIAENRGPKTIPVQTPKGLRATRTNVLDTGSLSGFTPGQQVYPSGPAEKQRSTEKLNKQIEALVMSILGGSLRVRQFVEVSIDDIIRIIRILPYDVDDGSAWDPDVIIAVLESISAGYDGRGLVHFREMERKTKRFSTGAASGKEVAEARKYTRPVLLLYKDANRGPAAPTHDYWYPTIVFPTDMASQVFNTTS